MNIEKIIRFKDSEKNFICPICKQPLYFENTYLCCLNKHCFDIAKQGYINLLPHSKQSKHYTKETFVDRGIIFKNGYYDHILQELLLILKSLTNVNTLLDVGCGEGYYSKQINELLGKELFSFDISKESIKLASKGDRKNSIKWFVGDLINMPIREQSIDCILDVFAPANYTEFKRVLNKKGYIIKIVPATTHLIELREAAKEQLRNNRYSNKEVKHYFGKNFSILLTKEVTKTYLIPSEHLEIFANMTPLLFNIHKEDIDLSGIRELTIGVEILVGQKLD